MRKQANEKTSGRRGDDEEALMRQKVEDVRGLVRRAIEHRRQAITYALAEVFLDTLESQVGTSGVTATGDSSWQRIESLSQLRAAVGGRFQNLKQKWVDAGFPLREHRGDREGKAKVDPEGWVELAVWVGKQGFEARLASEESPWLMEVRRV